MAGRALIAGIGQPWMRDLAFGSHVVQHLQARPLPSDIDVLDLSFGPITAFQIIEDGGYDRIVFVTARAAGREPASLYEAAVSPPEISREEMQLRVADCVMGCISLESLVLLCRFYGALPERCRTIEIEPEDETWGPELSEMAGALVEAAADLALRRVRPE